MRKCSLMALLLGGVAASGAREVRGVAPANLARYTGDRFTCLDGSITIPSAMINDDYCDCNDGSDEPGTSACRKGSFFCANKGYQSISLPSSRVNDGICDCCDGTDEWQGKVKCPNNCVELGRESLKDLIAEVDRYEAGVAKLQTLIMVGSGLKTEKDQALAQAIEQLAILENVLKTLEDTKNKEEAEEKAEQDRRAPPPPAEESPPSATQPTPDAAAHTEEKAAAGQEEERFPYPKEYQYKADEKKPEGEEGQEKAFPYPAEYAYKGNEGKEGKEGTQEEAREEEESETETEHHEAATAPPSPVVEKYISPAAEAARTAFHEKESEVRTARETRDRLQKELSNDFGERGEYMSLLGSCFEAQVRQYTYEACPYGSAAQKEGSSSTSLGTWAGFEKKENGQLVMKFAGGQRCWQGPERSFNVDVYCGADTLLSHVDEPSKCVYTAKLVTPAACNEPQARALREHLNTLLAAQS